MHSFCFSKYNIMKIMATSPDSSGNPFCSEFIWDKKIVTDSRTRAPKKLTGAAISSKKNKIYSFILPKFAHF
ncbi:MAG: hypothetical protein CUR32_02655 [Flavobacterium sp.]|nr:MAG: hypothetical protein CUR32_02655 [Flavobacterium sp.] [Flavobacterium sp. FEMGT703F]